MVTVVAKNLRIFNFIEIMILEFCVILIFFIAYGSLDSIVY